MCREKTAVSLDTRNFVTNSVVQMRRMDGQIQANPCPDHLPFCTSNTAVILLQIRHVARALPTLQTDTKNGVLRMK